MQPVISYGTYSIPYLSVIMSTCTPLHVVNMLDKLAEEGYEHHARVFAQYIFGRDIDTVCKVLLATTLGSPYVYSVSGLYARLKEMSLRSFDTDTNINLLALTREVLVGCSLNLNTSKPGVAVFVSTLKMVDNIAVSNESFIHAIYTPYTNMFIAMCAYTHSVQAEGV